MGEGPGARDPGPRSALSEQDAVIGTGGLVGGRAGPVRARAVRPANVQRAALQQLAEGPQVFAFGPPAEMAGALARTAPAVAEHVIGFGLQLARGGVGAALLEAVGDAVVAHEPAQPVGEQLAV